jgi:hypothetical protein
VTHADLLAVGATSQQADLIVAKAQVLRCWPDDVWVERDSHSSDLIVDIGLLKGRPHSFSLSSDGVLAPR